MWVTAFPTYFNLCVCVSQVEARLRKGYPRQDNMDVATDRYIASITRAIISLSKQSIAMISSFIGNQLFESHGAVPSIGQGLWLKLRQWINRWTWDSKARISFAFLHALGSDSTDETAETKFQPAAARFIGNLMAPIGDAIQLSALKVDDCGHFHDLDIKTVRVESDQQQPEPQQQQPVAPLEDGPQRSKQSRRKLFAPCSRVQQLEEAESQSPLSTFRLTTLHLFFCNAHWFLWIQAVN